MDDNIHLSAAVRQRPIWKLMPREGEDGLFSQNWYPICLSEELKAGEIFTRPFLNGEVIAIRASDNSPRVFAPYCLHLGANLKEGDMVEGRIRCPYHHWEYDASGTCVKTGAGDPPPRGACLFQYPVQERWGLVFVFNGENPLWDFPDFHSMAGDVHYDDSDLVMITRQIDHYPDDPERTALPVDPWVVMTNSLDFQHLVSLHHLQYEKVDPERDIQWSDHCAQYRKKSEFWNGESFNSHLAIYGNNCLYLSAELDERWFGLFGAQVIPSPGWTDMYFVVVADKGDGSPQAVEDAHAWAEDMMDMETKFYMQDVPVLRSIHFQPGLLTKIDAALARHIDYLHSQPRAHPAADFMR